MDDVTRRSVLAGMGASVLAANASATGVARSGPNYLNAHSGAWDTRRRAGLVFGGADERQVLGELWQFRLGRWRLLNRSGPRPRTFAAAAYDSRRDRFVVFGGNPVLFGRGTERTVFGDHWEWDGRRWLQFDGFRPPSRTEAAMAFDPVRGRMVLFGGWRFEGDRRVRLGDLWEFDGSSWVHADASGPDARSGHAITWDPANRRVLLAGGNGPRADFWALAAARWSRLPDLPQSRFNPVLAFDVGRNQAVLFGGWTGKERIASTSLFDGGGWRDYSGPEPAARNHSLFVPYGDGSRLLLIGGQTGADMHVLADQWEWAGHWRPLRTAPPKPRIPNDH